jgi:hypothetical protein
MLGRSAGGDVQRTNVFARALFAGRAADAPAHCSVRVSCVGKNAGRIQLSLNLIDACVPSQNGLLFEAPHLHKVTRLRTS